jgi:HEAT repeat protein
MALRNLGPAGLSAVGHLARVLSDPNPQVRQEAATTLGELGPDAAKSLPALRQMGNDPEETVVKAAARAIRKIDAASRVPSQTIPASATE